MNIAIIFGGKSAEHEVSLRSAKNIVASLKDKYDPILIGITRKGRWRLLEEVPEKEVGESGGSLVVTPGENENFLKENDLPEIDVCFPVLHGPYGEDGSMQGFFRMMEVPFVAPGVTGSAVAMDKEISKKILESADLKVADFSRFYKKPDPEIIEKKFDYPVFVKPANLGSSVGVSRAENRDRLMEAIKEAFQFDRKIIVEENLGGRELECSVLGDENPKASKVGEIIPENFYSYEEKYGDESSTKLKVPAEINPEIETEIKNAAIKAFQAHNCQGMARVDFFLVDGKVYVNELNTIPGFTNISMYPKLWEASGLSQEDLIEKLIQLAIERHKKRKQLKVTYN